jgi:hypothetical protein
MHPKDRETQILKMGGRASTPVLRVGKWVYDEASPVLYRENEFRFGNPAAMYFFMCQVRDQRRHIRVVEVDEWPETNEDRSWANHPACTMLADATSLQQVVTPNVTRILQLSSCEFFRGASY